MYFEQTATQKRKFSIRL